MKLSLKFLLPVAILSIISALVITTRSYQLSSEALLAASNSNKEIVVKSSIAELKEPHTFNVMNAISLAQTGLFQPFLLGTPEEIQENSQAATDRIVNMGKTYSYLDLGIIDTKGKVLKHTDTKNEGKSFADMPFFKEAMQGKISAGAPFLYNNRPAYTVASPVYKVGTKEIIGVVFNVSYINDEVSERMLIGNEGYMFIATKDGTVFLHTDKSKRFKLDLNSVTWGREMLSNKNGDLRFLDDNKDMIASYDTFGETGWLIGAVASASELNATSERIGISILTTAMIVLVFIILCAWFITNRITKRILLTVNYAKDVAAGKLDTILDVQSKDEVGQLSEALSSIPKVLKNIIQEYTRLEHEVRHGALLSTGDTKKFDGEFAELVTGTNNILKSFRSVLDNIPSPVIVLNNKLEAQYLNTVAAKISTANYKGKKCVELFAREDDSTEHDGLQNALKTKQPCSGETIAHPAGATLDIIYNAIPLVSPKNEVEMVLQLVTDITSLKESQKTIMRVAETATAISSQVATAAEQLSSQLQTAEESASIQAQRVSTAANTMATMNTTVIEMAVNAKEASEVSSVAKVEAENGAQVVQKAVSSIQVVQDQSHKLKKGMEQLNYSANAINEVITTISDIADQTNLLALNAAIEAARAGESGRGFAVVADEVRKLAEKTMTSTTEVRNAINSIQGSVNESVILVDDSVKAVELTSDLVTESGDVFLSIVNMVEQTATKSQVIASASDEQAISSEMVNGALGEVNLLATETANGMKEASLAVTDLSDQSQNLLELIAEMKKV